MCDSNIDSCPRGNVVCFSDLKEKCSNMHSRNRTNLVLFVHGEQTRVVTLLNGNKCYSRLIAAFQEHACFAHCTQFMLQNLNDLNYFKTPYFLLFFLHYIQKLSFTNSLTIDNDASWLEAGASIKLNQKFANHVCQFGNYFLKLESKINYQIFWANAKPVDAAVLEQ